MNPNPNSIRYDWLAETQASCEALQQRLTQDPTRYHRKPFGRNDIELIYYSPTPEDESSLKIVLTDEVDAAVEYLFSSPAHGYVLCYLR